MSALLSCTHTLNDLNRNRGWNSLARLELGVERQAVVVARQGGPGAGRHGHWAQNREENQQEPSQRQGHVSKAEG